MMLPQNAIKDKFFFNKLIKIQVRFEFVMQHSNFIPKICVLKNYIIHYSTNKNLCILFSTLNVRIFNAVFKLKNIYPF